VESKAAQDTIKASAISRDLLEHGWSKENAGSLKSLGAAYLTGLLLAKKLKGFTPAILDTGLIRSTKGSRVYAAVKGLIEGGFEVPCSKEVFPAESRLTTEKTKEFFNKIKENIIKGAKK
jgi:large subunit ribosomal protein L18